MAEKELAILLRAKGAVQTARDIGKVDSAVGKLGRTAATGARTAVTNIAKLGVVAGAGIAVAVKGGLDSLAELETAVTSVDGAISQLGLTGKLTGAQVAGWANDIERDIGAAFDDKAITAAAATLIRFGQVTPQNLRPALVVMTDLAVKTGDVDSAATLLAKALADPEKAAGKLAKSGVILTKVEQDQIKAFVKAGKTADAQRVILDALTKVTKGAAAASQGPYARSLSILADVTEDARKALATGFLPVIEKVADLLSHELAKKSTIDGIKAFGQSLAGGLDRLITVARGLPWGAIGDSLRIAGVGAKAVFDAFMAMPPWVQTAVLTGWGLNKLTGGALGSLVGQLASGLIKGVLGINAGVVNINAGVVRGGGVPGVVPAGGRGVGGALATAAKWILPVGIAVAIADLVLQHAQSNPVEMAPKFTRPAPVALSTRDILRVTDKEVADRVQGLADQRRGEIMEGRASTASLHTLLNELIGKQGGAFLRAGEKAKTLDENAGKLVQLFQTSTNPSLKSMQDNLGILKGQAAKGDAVTRAKLSDDIKALQSLIDRKLADLLVATQALRGWTTGNQGWLDQREGERGGTVTVNASVSARDVTRAQQIRLRHGPLIAQ